MTNEVKVSKRDYLNAIIKAMKTGEIKYNPDDVIAFCEHEIELLDKKTAKAKERAEAKRAEGDELTEQIYDVLSADEFMTIPEIVKALGNEDVSAQKASYRLRGLVNENRAEKTEVSVAGADGGKASKKVAYRKLVDGSWNVSEG